MLVDIIVDIVLLTIVVVGGILGYRYGFVITITKPVKWFAALLLAFLLCEVVATNIVVPLIEAPLTNQLTEYLTEKCGEMTKETVSAQMPTLLKLAAGFVGIDITAFESGDSTALIAEIVDKLASPAIKLFAMILAFFALYVFFKLFLGLIIKLLDRIFSIGAIGVVNSALGLIFGAAFAFVIAWLLVVLIGYIISIPKIAEVEWIKNFNGWFIYDFFESFTPLDLLLSF